MNEFEVRFVNSFIQKDRRERYLEMLKKGKRRKFLDEMCGRMWHHLNPNTTMHCRRGVTIHQIIQTCPEVSKIESCHVTDYDKQWDNCSVKMVELLQIPDVLMTTNAHIITLIPEKVALYCLEGLVALCYRSSQTADVTATFARFSALVDKKWTSSK